MRSKLTPLLVAAALVAPLGSANADYARRGMRSAGSYHHGMTNGRYYGMSSNRYGYTRTRYGVARARYRGGPAYYGAAAPGYGYGSGYGYGPGYAAGGLVGGVATGVGTAVSAPFDFLGGLFGGGSPDYGTYGYGGASYGYGAGQPVVAGY